MDISNSSKKGFKIGGKLEMGRWVGQKMAAKKRILYLDGPFPPFSVSMKFVDGT